ncbi:MAG: IS200/IS605 family transposase [Phycisphaerae bacterium]
MSSHVYHEIFLHLNWHTKLDQPLLSGQVGDLTYAAIHDKCQRIKGARLHGIGGIETHVHLAVSIDPFVTISDLVQELKGASAHQVNKRLRHKALEWQRGYGVVSFGKQNLDWVLKYIQNQRDHHAQGRTQPRLETCDQAPFEKPG